MRTETLRHLETTELHVIASSCMISLDINRNRNQVCMQLVRLYLSVSGEIATRQIQSNHRSTNQYALQ